MEKNPVTNKNYVPSDDTLDDMFGGKSLEEAKSDEDLQDSSNLAEIFDAQNPQSNQENQIVNPELSPAASMIRHAANRVAGAMEQRAMGKLQSEALVTNTAFDAQQEVNAAHDEAITMDPRESQAAYERSHDEAIAENEDFDYDKALDMNKAIDRTERKAERREKLDEAKTKVRRFGSSAIRRMKNAGMITLGVGLLAGEAGVRGAKSGAETVALGALYAKDTVASAAETTALKSLYTADKVKDGAAFVGNTVRTNAEAAVAVGKYQAAQAGEAISGATHNAMDKAEELAGNVGQKIENGVANTIDYVSEKKEALIGRMNLARERRQARKDRWAAKRREVVQAAGEKVERAKASVHTTRAAGRAAMDAFKDTRNVHAEQNKLY